MRKSELIKMLESIEGNPEIVLWNGFVGDYMHIDPKPIKGDLVKMTESYYLESCRMGDAVHLKKWDYQLPKDEIEFLKKNYKKVCKFEVNSYVTLDDIKEKKYTKKRVVFLNAKIRGEKYSDRLGDMCY